VDDAVHAGYRVAGAGELLAVELQRNLAERIEAPAYQLQLDQQTEAAAGIVVGFFAGARTQDLCHQETDFAGSEELTRALTLPFGELAQQVFVAAAEEIRFDVVQAETVARIGEGLDDALERLVGNLALAVTRLVEVDGVDDASGFPAADKDGAVTGAASFCTPRPLISSDNASPVRIWPSTGLSELTSSVFHCTKLAPGNRPSS
jgi:hypothetical protein